MHCLYLKYHRPTAYYFTIIHTYNFYFRKKYFTLTRSHKIINNIYIANTDSKWTIFYNDIYNNVIFFFIKPFPQTLPAFCHVISVLLSLFKPLNLKMPLKWKMAQHFLIEIYLKEKQKNNFLYKCIYYIS